METHKVYYIVRRATSVSAQYNGQVGELIRVIHNHRSGKTIPHHDLLVLVMPDGNKLMFPKHECEEVVNS